MTAKTLRALAKDHANGVLDKDSYRKERDAWFDAVLSGQLEVTANEYRPLVEVQDLDNTFEKTAVNIVTPSSEQPPPRPTVEFVPPDSLPYEPVVSKKSSLPAGLLAGAIAISIIIIVILVSLMMDKPDTEIDDATVAADESEDTPVATTASVEDLIVEFLRYNDWSDSSLQQFSERWGNLDSEEQQRGLSSPQMTRLSNAIYQQLVEARSGLGQGDDTTIMARQYALVDFATLLGISDARLVVREADPSAASSINDTE